MAQSVQICATIETKLRNEITKIADKEKRSFSQMVEILLLEATEKRKK